MAFAKKEEGLAEIKPANIIRTTLNIQGKSFC